MSNSDAKYEKPVAQDEAHHVNHVGDVELAGIDISMSRTESAKVLVARRVNSETSAARRQGLSVAALESMVEDNRVFAVRRVSSSVLSMSAVNTVHRPNIAEIKDELEKQDENMKYTEHLFTLKRISSFFKTDIDLDDVKNSKGLTSAQAAYMLKEFGGNVLSPPPKVPLWLLFLLQFTNFFMILLIMAGLLCLILFAISPDDFTNLYLGLILFFIVFFTAYETFQQEAKSDELMERFRAMIPQAASVVRDGTILNVKAEELVVGDLVFLKSGEKIPADCRVVSSSSLKVDQSMITGESEPIDVVEEAMDNNPLEARNIIFNGSLAVDGSCLAVIIRTGNQTLIGTMVDLTGDTGKAQSTLKADIQSFVIWLAKFALIQAIICFVAGVSQGVDPITAFVQGFVVVMVANVPQGLPTTITAALYIVAERMAKQNVFVKKLDIIETLGSCSMICTDKTGTLTQNIMTVANIWVTGHKYTADEALAAINHQKEHAFSGEYNSLRRLLDVISLNSRIVLEKKSENEGNTPSGDATEVGLYRFCGNAISKAIGGSSDIEDYRKQNDKVFEIPFNSSNKWQLSIHTMRQFTIWDSEGVPSSQEAKDVIMFKGAPDVILSKCSHYMERNGACKEINPDFIAQYNSQYEAFGGEGERVLGFAFLPMDRRYSTEINSNPEFTNEMKDSYIGKGVNPAKNLCFVGLATLLDPPRPEVASAIKDCHSAGIKVVMVTGDHPLTAASIAKKIGLITKPTREDIARQKSIDISMVTESEIKAVVVHGSKIPLMSDQDWAILTKKDEIVFARTSPEQKLIIVKKFTEAGNVCAMTGDGVNDSPALKQAAIGVAMGLSGSDVAREAADLVLLDDNFASIVVGVREGRLLFANLKKSIAYTLTHLVPEIVPVLIWAFIGFPQTLSGILILFFDIITEVLNHFLSF